MKIDENKILIGMLLTNLDRAKSDLEAQYKAVKNFDRDPVSDRVRHEIRTAITAIGIAVEDLEAIAK